MWGVTPRRCSRTLPLVLTGALAVPVAAPAATVPDPGSVVGSVTPPNAVAPATGALTRAASAVSCSGTRARPSRLAAADARAALLCAINQARARHGLPALGDDRRLRRAAHGQARDMVRRHYFAHQRPGGPSLSARLRRAGWHGSRAGEALAWGCGSSATAGATVQAWLHSPPHREILLSTAYSLAGVGVAARAPVHCGPGATWVLDAGG
jgi:uncharacterized protein YkwD